MIEKYLPVFIVLSLVAEILGTVGGFGSSVYFVPIANFFLDFNSVLAITALFHLSSNVAKIAIFKKGFDKKIVLSLGIPAVLFVSLGAWLSKLANPGLLTILLGVFLILLSLLFLIFRELVVPPTRRNAILGGAFSGLSAGILGTGGAIRGITLSAFNLDKNKFIATSALIDLGVDVSRTVVYYFNGYMKFEHIYLALILLVIGFVGTWIGKRILDRVSQDQFRSIVLLLILAIGIATIISEWL